MTTLCTVAIVHNLEQLNYKKNASIFEYYHYLLNNINSYKEIIMNTILNYETWIEQNNDNLYILAAESGVDREYDFDEDRFCEEQYEDYLKAV